MKNEIDMDKNVIINNYNGWEHEFNLHSIPEWLENAIRDNKRKTEDTLKKRSEKNLREKQEEIDRLKGQLNELMCKAQLRNALKSKYAKTIWCPCMNSGNGGLIMNDEQTPKAD